MRRFYLFLGLILVYSFVAVAMNNRVFKDKMKGKWDVYVPDAPSGYQKYVAEITENNKAYRADIFFVETQTKISNQTFVQKGGKLTGSIYAGNEKVEITIREEKGTVRGTAAVPSAGELPMIFTRIEK